MGKKTKKDDVKINETKERTMEATRTAEGFEPIDTPPEDNTTDEDYLEVVPAVEISTVDQFREIAEQVDFEIFEKMPKGITLKDFTTGDVVKFEDAHVLKVGRIVMILSLETAIMGRDAMAQEGVSEVIYRLPGFLKRQFGIWREEAERKAIEAKREEQRKAREEEKKAQEEAKKAREEERRAEVRDHFNSPKCVLKIRGERFPDGIFMPIEGFHALNSPADMPLEYDAHSDGAKAQFEKVWPPYFKSFMDKLKKDMPKDVRPFNDFKDRFNSEWTANSTVPYLKAVVVQRHFGPFGIGVFAVLSRDQREAELRMKAEGRIYKVYPLVDSYLFQAWIKAKEEAEQAKKKAEKEAEQAKVDAFAATKKGLKASSAFAAAFAAAGISTDDKKKEEKKSE